MNRDTRRIEDRLRAAFRACTDAVTPAQLNPAAVPSGPGPVRRWILPLLAAACVVLIAAAVAVAATGAVGHNTSPPLAPPTPAPSLVPSPVPSATPTPHATSAVRSPSPPPVVRTGRTVTRHFEPWAGSEPKAGSVVLANVTAHCQSSNGTYRLDAYRCFTNREKGSPSGFIRDPCFASPTNAHRLLCPAGRLVQQRFVLVIADSSSMPNRSSRRYHRDEPWAIDVAGFGTCRFSSGAVNVVRGLPELYHCTDGHKLWGRPDRSKPVWTIPSSRSENPPRFDTVTIATAWF